MQYFWTVTELIPNWKFDSGGLEYATHVGIVMFGLGLAAIFLLVYMVAKLSIFSVYIVDHLLRGLWMMFKNVLPSIIVVIVYHVIVHTKTRTPQEAAGLLKGLYDMLWKS